jgi:L-ascorbate metabolism protein UlaG (beta-lactamase superfamily)
MVILRWLGHECFEIKDARTVVTDPHDGEGIGLPRPIAKADIVTVSHGHFDHANGVDIVSKQGTVVIKTPGEHPIKGIAVKGIAAFHDNAQGAMRGENIIFTVKMDGISFCHLGDLGHLLSEEQLREIGDVDVLLIPVGGHYTIDANEAAQIMDRINPRIVIPMHYKIEGLTVDIADAEPFLRDRKNVRRYSENQVQIEKDALPARTEIWVLSPPKSTA